YKNSDGVIENRRNELSSNIEKNCENCGSRSNEKLEDWSSEIEKVIKQREEKDKDNREILGKMMKRNEFVNIRCVKDNLSKGDDVDNEEKNKRIVNGLNKKKLNQIKDMNSENLSVIYNSNKDKSNESKA
ncbi:7338_t:CDS:2, partial [Dentiscutata erythropus]